MPPDRAQPLPLLLAALFALALLLSAAWRSGGGSGGAFLATAAAPPPPPPPLPLPLPPRNFSLADHPRAPPLRIAALGDSLTGGLMCASGGYARILGSLAGPAYEVRHFFIHGIYATPRHPRTHEALPHSVSAVLNGSLLAQARDFAPDIYLVLLGTNDALADWYEETALEGALADLLRALQRGAGAPEVFALTSPPLRGGEAAPGLTGAQARAAAAAGAGLVDVFAALAGAAAADGLFCDGLHTTFLGDQVIAGAVAAALQAALVAQRGWPQFAAGGG
jgi:hypothetical protein